MIEFSMPPSPDAAQPPFQPSDMTEFDAVAYKAAQVQHWVEQAVQPFVKVWPLQTFIACNPLLHYEGSSFFDAIQQAQAELQWDGPFQPHIVRQVYQRAVQGGQLSMGHLSDRFDAYIQRENLSELRVGPRELSLKNFLWADLQASFSLASEQIEAGNTLAESLMPTLRPLLASQHALTDANYRSSVLGEALLSQVVGQLTGQRIELWIDEQMVKWCASFLDQGQAIWVMPHREHGLRAAWQQLVGFDHHLPPTAVSRLRQLLPTLPADSDEAIGELLLKMGVSEWHAVSYLRAHLARLPGWVGHLRWVSEARHMPSIISDYLLLRLCYEWAYCGTTVSPQQTHAAQRHALEAQLQAHRQAYDTRPSIISEKTSDEAALQQAAQLWSQRIANLAPSMALQDSILQAICQTSGEALIGALAALDWNQKGRILIEAMEANYQSALLDKLTAQLPRLQSSQESGIAEGQTMAPATLPTNLAAVQAVFCIDVRSEPFRRQLESLGNVETFGFAGFFGAAIQRTALGECNSQDLCPALLKPAYAISEEPWPNHAEDAHRYLGNKANRKRVNAQLKFIKREPVSMFGYVEALALTHAVPMVMGTLFPRWSAQFKKGFQQFFEPAIEVRPRLAAEDHSSSEAISGLGSGSGSGLGSGSITELKSGMPLAAQVQVAAGLLSSIGLRQNFAPLVMLCGHGTQVANNPYASALDCGACGGNQGGANARVAAEILNNPVVRQQLAAQGICIPEATRFLAAEHNTVTDEVRILNTSVLLAGLPEGALALQQLEAKLKRAAELNRQARGLNLPTLMGDASGTHEQFGTHAVDWSQIRPEWGLAGNASFIIGPRDLTSEIDLEGRAFLHSYNWRQDPEGQLLESILTAPLVVGEWINMQYLFSTLDNQRFGSGSKVAHNVVGQVGVMLGNASDLQIGLPQQSVMIDAETPYHLPLRLTAVVVAPMATVERLIQRQAILQTLFHHEWVKLLVLDPDSAQFHCYSPDGSWQLAL